MVREVAHARKRNPLFDLDKILQGGRYARHSESPVQIILIVCRSDNTTHNLFKNDFHCETFTL